MSTLDEIRKIRIQKCKALKEQGINPYPSRVILPGKLTTIAAARQSLGKIVLVAGRLGSVREHGTILFVDLKDESGKIQLLFKKNNLEEKYQRLLKFIDHGDFVAANGVVTQTKTSEITIEVKEIQLLTKSLRPIPTEWFGLKDEEERLRKRYIDLLLNPEIKELFVKKAKFWQSVRNFLLEKGFLEVETPVLEVTTGGADARPFVTFHNALDINVYLRISMGELWQKRLMVAGYQKTFEIGRQFRNEGMDAEHLQDYTQMEFYWAYADYRDGMQLVEEMIKQVAQETFGTQQFTIGSFEIDLGKKWEIYDYQETVKQMTGIDITQATLEEIKQKLDMLGINYQKTGFNLSRAIDSLWKYCRKQIAGPGFLIHAPVIVSPLAKRCEQNPMLTERFQIIIAGSELGNGYSELNDPLDQAARFSEQQKLREAGDEEAQMYDYEFVEALEYGMPPTCGFGMSERLFAFLANKTMRECQLFPLLRPRKKE